MRTFTTTDPEVTATLADIESRQSELERNHLEFLHRLTLAEQKVADYEARLGSVEVDRGAYKDRVDTVEKIPVATATKVEALEKRLRTVEGAVGSANLASSTDIDPAKPFDPPQPLAAPPHDSLPV